MKSKIFKSVLLTVTAVLAVCFTGFAQDIAITISGTTVKAKCNDKELQLKMDELGKNLNDGLKDLGKSLTLTLNNIVPKVNIDLKGMGNSYSYSYSNSDSASVSENDENSGKEKVKNYSKTYPLDGNDKIKVSNQYGKITVTTWDRHEVKVDVQVRAEANDDDYAQKLLDGVQIIDSKNGDLVSFRTEIERNDGSWKIWNWSGNKMHKLTINYTVYMPAKTDLNVEQSYGGIELPDLAGRVKINSSYGSVSAENLTNPANEIEGSYGSLKVGAMNGGRLDYSYGSVSIDECNNIKADLSYGSFKLGKLKGVAELELSYEGGFKIEELGNSFKRLNIDASYSGVSVGIPGSNNFDFDVTTTYGGFNYNDDKVTITSKTPPDGSKHIGPTRNYKGHFGKDGAEAQVNIHSTYGGVNFE